LKKGIEMLTKYAHIRQPKVRARKRKRQQKAVLVARRLGVKLAGGIAGVRMPIRSDFQ
jgi:hypothetical protein